MSDFTPPTKEEIQEVVDSLGGYGAVCRILRKRRSTVWRWCKGDARIDYANWKLLKAIR